MTLQEILEGNKLIAEFMGFQINENWVKLNDIDEMNISNLKYHSLWDRLMPVVEKMEEMGYCFTSDPWSHELIEYGTGDECVILYHQFDSDSTKIEAMYLAVLKFIKWYNQNKV